MGHRAMDVSTDIVNGESEETLKRLLDIDGYVLKFVFFITSFSHFFHIGGL